MTDSGKRSDDLLDKLSKTIKERDAARLDLAAERVAHRLTRKELAAAVDLAVRV